MPAEMRPIWLPILSLSRTQIGSICASSAIRNAHHLVILALIVGRISGYLEWSRCVTAHRVALIAGHRSGRQGGLRSAGVGTTGMCGPWVTFGLAGEGTLDGRCDQACSEEPVHDLGACGDDRPQFPAVDDFGGAGGGVPGEAGDLLDADAAVAEQADEGGPLPWTSGVS